MKVLVTGSDTISNELVVIQAIIDAGFPIDAIIFRSNEPGSPSGVDAFAKKWADDNGKQSIEVVPDYTNLTVAKAEVRIHPITRRPYNHRAPVDANRKALEMADAIIAVWDGQSSGFRSVLKDIREKHASKPTWIVVHQQ